MHGRLKVRTTEEQRLIKEKEQQKKLEIYRQGMKQISATRNEESYEPSSLMLCSQLLLANPDIYTLWNYRKEVVLIELKQKLNDDEDETDLVKFLENELRLTEQCLVQNPKSYSSWHHRYWVLSHHPKPDWSKEFDLCTKYLTIDDRNFHCWDYRRLIINKIGVLLTDELKFSTDRLNVNFSNYSSWHYRSTLRCLDQESAKTELSLVTNAVFTDPMDSSAWFYLRWVLGNPVPTEKRKEMLEALEQLQEMEPDCKWVLLSKCWLTVGDCRQFYRELITLDLMRKGYYEYCLEKAAGNE